MGHVARGHTRLSSDLCVVRMLVNDQSAPALRAGGESKMMRNEPAQNTAL